MRKTVTGSDRTVRCSCQTNAEATACLEEMFVGVVQKGRIARGQEPARRPVFLRLHGVAHGRFEMAAEIPASVRHGVFQPGAVHPAWVRISSDIPDGVPDLKSTVGFGIKLFEVAGEKCLPPDGGAPTVDFLLQNVPFFFVDNALEMCAFTRASLNGEGGAWLKDHPKTARLLDAMEQVVESALDIDLWSVIPFQLGEGAPEAFCKYKVSPEQVPPGPPVDTADPFYLARDVEARLKNGEARFGFFVQRRSDPAAMPLDELTVVWPETPENLVRIGTLILPQQDVTSRCQADYGEALAFNPWRALAANQPVGSIAEVRKVVYQRSAEVRRDVNGQTVGEPTQARGAGPFPAGFDSHIVSAKIHPAIGVCRVGNSTAEDGWYLGPEVPQPPPTAVGATRDASGAIKREAARFRVYGYNAAGQVVSELTADNAVISWTAHLVNRKAQWYRFDAAMDLPSMKQVTVPLRNPKVSDRDSLAIDPGPKSIAGADAVPVPLDGGHFVETPVNLGELRTDDKGRLIVLGGHGVSASPENTPIYSPSDPGSFNNADGWYDDTGDGSIDATVHIQGRPIQVEGAWVIAAPPNFAPDVVAWRSQYDLQHDLAVEQGWLKAPAQVSFATHIRPILERMNLLEWVNYGFGVTFGHGAPFDFGSSQLMERLAQAPGEDGSDPWRELRQQVFNAFRPAADDPSAADNRAWPWIYGDGFGVSGSERLNLATSPQRHALLQRWADGKFLGGLEPPQPVPTTLAGYPLADQPHALDEASMTFCLADAFHPGCEITWPMRHASLYSAPFRIKRGRTPADYGPTLDQATALSVTGPLNGQSPGDLTRWMALPWQADTTWCRSGYDANYDPYIPTYWPGRVPNWVMSTDEYQTVMNQDLSREERLEAYNDRTNWFGALPDGIEPPMLEMVAHFDQQLIVEQRPGVPDDPDFPPLMLVGSGPAIPKVRRSTVVAEVQGLMASVPAVAADPVRQEAEHRARRAGWASSAQMEAVKAWRFAKKQRRQAASDGA